MSRNLPAERRVAVIKIGGSILTSAKAYRRAALFVRNRHRAAPWEDLVVVVSAQQGATDRLEREARKIVREPNARALDLLWSTGELRSVALLALHLQALGVSAAALNVHGAGLHVSGECEDRAQEEKRTGLNARWIRGALEEHPVAVVPGFFATDAARAFVWLGRGGSDLTAVLLAKGLEACRCELLKDVPGYFSSDAHRDPAAWHLPTLTFAEALDRLTSYPFYHAALGEFEFRSGRREIAREHFRIAVALGRNPMERQFFEQRIGACERPAPQHVP